ncbi:MAG: nitrous oxide reductase family maturation protein NosD [Solirubrobacterales bacterium]
MLAAAGAVACFATAGTAQAATTKVCPSGCFFSTIQSAINAAPSGATIVVGAGSYYENLVIDRPLTLKGSGANTIVYPSLSQPTCPAGKSGSLCGGEASNIILVQADNVTIATLTLRGDNPNLTSGVVVGGEDIDARNGIITNHLLGTYNNLKVTGVKIKGVYLRGIYASSGGTFNFTSNSIDNVQAEEASIAMFDFGGAGVFAKNKVTNANDAISANHSTGTEFISNIVLKSGSGVHTDNNGDSGGTADVIKGNSVRECKTDGYGVFVFVPYKSPTVEANKITGCAVGLAAYGGAVAGEGGKFVGNIVNGIGAKTSNNAGTYGAYLTTDQLGFEFGDLTATLTGNQISHFNTGLFVTQTTPTEGQPAGGQATVTATPNNSFFTNGTGADGDTGTVVKAEEDWWGCAKGPNMGGPCNTATGTVTYTPFLTAKP